MNKLIFGFLVFVLLVGCTERVVVVYETADAGPPVGDSGLPTAELEPRNVSLNAGHSLRFARSTDFAVTADVGGLYPQEATYGLSLTFEGFGCPRSPTGGGCFEYLMLSANDPSSDPYQLFFLRLNDGIAQCVWGTGSGEHKVSAVDYIFEVGTEYEIECKRTRDQASMRINGEVIVASPSQPYSPPVGFEFWAGSHPNDPTRFAGTIHEVWALDGGGNRLAHWAFNEGRGDITRAHDGREMLLGGVTWVRE